MDKVFDKRIGMDAVRLPESDLATVVSVPSPIKPLLIGVTDRGLKRTNNEDAICTSKISGKSENLVALLMVADGMGGAPAGEVASSLAVRVVEAAIGRRKDRFQDMSERQWKDFLTGVIEVCNRRVLDASHYPGRNGMGTTLTIAVVTTSMVYLAHVGDSRAYIFRDGQLSLMTNDHTWSNQELKENGNSSEQAGEPLQQGMLANVVGVDKTIWVDTCCYRLHPRDVVMLCSDGLHSVVSDKDIELVMGITSGEQYPTI